MAGETGINGRDGRCLLPGAHLTAIKVPDNNAAILGAAHHPLAVRIRRREDREDAVLAILVACKAQHASFEGSPT